MGIEVGSFVKRYLCPATFYYKPPPISLTPFSLIPQFPALPPFLSPASHAPLSLYIFCPTLLSLSPVLLVLLTSCIRQGGKAPLTTQHLVCFISHIISLIIFCVQTPIFLSPPPVLNISQLSLLIFSLLQPTYTPPIFFLTFITAIIFSFSLLSPPSSLLFIEGCLLMVS